MAKISIILPVYNEAESLVSILERIEKTLSGFDYEIIAVDDGSTDGSSEILRKTKTKVIRHPYNIGNGAAIKSGIRAAKGDIIVLMDADGQHNPSDIPKMLKLIGEYDMIVGARIRSHGAPMHRRWANIFYNKFASYLVMKNIQDLTSGFRAIKADIAKKFVYLLPNTFSYPSTITMALFRAGYSVGYIPIEVTKRAGKSKINLVADGSRFLLIIMKIATLFNPLRIFVPASLVSFTIGFGHAFIKIFILHEKYTGFSILFITTGIMIFLMGLIAEQIAQLRLERSEGE